MLFCGKTREVIASIPGLTICTWPDHVTTDSEIAAHIYLRSKVGKFFTSYRPIEKSLLNSCVSVLWRKRALWFAWLSVGFARTAARISLKTFLLKISPWQPLVQTSPPIAKMEHSIEEIRQESNIFPLIENSAAGTLFWCGRSLKTWWKFGHHSASRQSFSPDLVCVARWNIVLRISRTLWSCILYRAERCIRIRRASFWALSTQTWSAKYIEICPKMFVWVYRK